MVSRGLLDANVVISMLSIGHQHHLAAVAWFGEGRSHATCSIVEMSFLRYAVRNHISVDDALDSLASLADRDDHEYWSDPLRPDAANMSGVIGHRQVTDFYLAALARDHEGRLATFDSGLAAAHPDVVDLIATDVS